MADPIPDLITKRGDTWEPLTGRITDKNGPIDLTGATLRFLALTTIDDVEIIVDSAQSSPDHGECINVEDADGPGDTISIVFPPGSGIFIDVLENRGVWRFEPTVAAVSQAALYRFEIEAMKAGKPITFPNDASRNPYWLITPDIA